MKGRELQTQRTGLLVTNSFNDIPSFRALYARLDEAADAVGIQLIRRTNAQLCELMLSGGTDAGTTKLTTEKLPAFGLFWDKDLHLARALESRGVRLFNSARTIAICDDKALSAEEFARLSLPTPKTLIGPKTYKYLVSFNDDLRKHVNEAFSYPIVVKEVNGSFGKQVHLAHDDTELQAIIESFDGRDYLIQEFIAESTGRDVRVIVVGGRVIAAMERVNTAGDFRSNIAQGAQGKACELTPEQKELALAVCAGMGVDFAGVDLLESNRGPLLCEINSNPHFAGIEACTGADIAGAIISHVAQHA